MAGLLASINEFKADNRERLKFLNLMVSKTLQKVGMDQLCIQTKVEKKIITEGMTKECNVKV